jgi:hypothetical protein
MLVFGIAVSVAKMFWAVPHPDVYYIRLGMAAGTVLLTPYVLSRLEEEGSLDPEKYIKR